MSTPAGIGCVLSATCVVQSLKDGGAAACCGLIVAGDRLEAIDGVRVSSDAQARPMILGHAGTQVTLAFDRNGSK
jgi:C-terminal processing protease CtpA/Prc